MPGGRERNILRWELRASLLRDQIAHLDERLAGLEIAALSNGSFSARQREELLAQRADLVRELDAIGPDPRAKMG